MVRHTALKEGGGGKDISFSFFLRCGEEEDEEKRGSFITMMAVRRRKRSSRGSEGEEEGLSKGLARDSSPLFN